MTPKRQPKTKRIRAARGKSGRFSHCRGEIMESRANRAVIWVCVNAKTHATVSVPTLAVCLMLTERETERERLAVFGVNVCVYVCVCEKGEDVMGQEGGGYKCKREGSNPGSICTSSTPN